MSIDHSQALNDPVLLRQVNDLRRSDNLTNWYYLAREYLFIGLVVWSCTILYQHYEQGKVAWPWLIPITVLAVVLVGAGQHRLITLAHEASHYMLFRNRWLNELASDVLCMFPLFSVTHNYRLQHLAHHQYVNDPERDPDLVFMRESGHEYEFPMPWARFWWICVVRPLLWVPGLLRYLGIRARQTATGGTGPYARTGGGSKLLVRVGVAYLLSLVGILTALTLRGRGELLLAVPAAMLIAIITFYWVVPDRYYPQTIVRPVIAPRWWTILRMTYATVLFTAIAWLTRRTGQPWALYYFVLWVVPLGTTFAFFMILREAVQHGDAGRTPYRHTRIFEGNPLVRWAVFPLGMDYHLPHHCFPMVPHYRLKALHQLLRRAACYADAAIVVHGYLIPQRASADQAGPVLTRLEPREPLGAKLARWSPVRKAAAALKRTTRRPIC